MHIYTHARNTIAKHEREFYPSLNSYIFARYNINILFTKIIFLNLMLVILAYSLELVLCIHLKFLWSLR